MRKLTPGMHQDAIALDREWTFDNTDYIISLYHKYAEDLLNAQVKQQEFYKRCRNPMFGDVEGEFLYLSMRDMQPEVVVDVGVGCGWSTSWLLRGLLDNGHGHLTSCDTDGYGQANLLLGFEELPSPMWTFLHGDSRDQVFPETIDFLLSDSDHNMPYAQEFTDRMFPRVRPGGRICVHDVFALKTPAHGEAMTTFIYLDKIRSYCYSVSHCWEDRFAKILIARNEIGLIPQIHCDMNNTLLIFDVPTYNAAGGNPYV